MVHEEDGEEYFISRKALQEQILKAEIGQDVNKDADVFPNGQQQMKDIIQKQQILLQNREREIKK